MPKSKFIPSNCQPYLHTAYIIIYFVGFSFVSAPCSVVVTQVLGNSMFLICYCDYGDIVLIQSDRLKVLPALFRQLPALAISARLSGTFFAFN